MMLLALMLCALVAVSRAEKVDQHIVNGEIATYGQHPYICSLQQYYEGYWYHMCGAVIWDERNVVTAAHCLVYHFSWYRVSCGLHNMYAHDTYQVYHGLEGYAIHPLYDEFGDGWPNDIAVIKLYQPLQFNEYVRSGTFANKQGDYAGQSCTLSGWGLTSGGGIMAGDLKSVNITKITNELCETVWRESAGPAINDRHICFLEPGTGKSSCNGDSGGPVRCGDVITGITSWGATSCDGDYPSVYTRVSRFYDWLNCTAAVKHDSSG